MNAHRIENAMVCHSTHDQDPSTLQENRIFKNNYSYELNDLCTPVGMLFKIYKHCFHRRSA